MCLAIPGRVERISAKKVEVSYGRQRRTALLAGDVAVKEGDYVLVQMGCVVQKLSEEEARESIAAWKSAKEG